MTTFSCRFKAPLLSRRAFVAATIVSASGMAMAQSSYPTRPVTFIIPFPAGTGNDVVGRIVGRKASEMLGQPVVVDNRPGAFGNIAIDATRRAEPNGYTAAVASTSFSINRWTIANTNYSVSDFTPIAMIGKQPYSLMVSKSAPANTIRDLVEMLKAKPGQFNHGQGSGTAFLLFSAFKKETGVVVENIAYKGTTEAVMDILAGRIELLFAPITTALPYYKSGEAKVVCITGSERSQLMPDVPTFTESGFPALDIPTWFALLGPKGIPANEVRILGNAVENALKAQDVVAQLNQNGVTADFMSSASLGSFLQQDMERWERIVQESGFTPQ